MINKRLRNLKFIPREIRGVTELRRNPSKVFEMKEAVEEAAELADALDSVEIYRRERSAGKLRELTSLKDLLNEN